MSGITINIEVLNVYCGPVLMEDDFEDDPDPGAEEPPVEDNKPVNAVSTLRNVVNGH